MKRLGYVENDDCCVFVWCRADGDVELWNSTVVLEATGKVLSHDGRDAAGVPIRENETPRRSLGRH